MDKVLGGTPKGSTSLCVTCRNAHHLIGINMQSEIRCTRVGYAPIVSFPVAQCSNYDDKRMPSLSNMYDIAWQVESRNRGPVGFGDKASNLEVKITAPNRSSQPEATPTARDGWDG